MGTAFSSPQRTSWCFIITIPSEIRKAMIPFYKKGNENSVRPGGSSKVMQGIKKRVFTSTHVFWVPIQIFCCYPRTQETFTGTYIHTSVDAHTHIPHTLIHSYTHSNIIWFTREHPKTNVCSVPPSPALSSSPSLWLWALLPSSGCGNITLYNRTRDFL